VTTVVETVPATGHADEPTEPQRAQPDWRARYPARRVMTDWPATCADRDEVDRIVAAAADVLPSERVREARRWGCRCC
jgi:hypothetical protein